MDVDSLHGLSIEVGHMAVELYSLPLCIRHEQQEAAQFAVRQICRTLDNRAQQFTQTAGQFSLARSTAELVSIAGSSYTSAHDAALVEADHFFSLLWWSLDDAANNAYRKAWIKGEDSSLRRANTFDPNLVLLRWEMTEAVVRDKLTKHWQSEFSEIPARIQDERARVLASLETTFTAGGWITVEEAARLAQRSAGTISRAATNGLIEDNGKTGRGRRFSRDSVAQYFLEASAE